MTLPRFLIFFPEFAQSDMALVAAKLSEASARMGGPDPRIWGSYALDTAPPNTADIAQGNLAAHYLVSGPFGTETRSSPDGKKSEYWDKWEECMYAASGGVTVAGGGIPCFPWYGR